MFPFVVNVQVQKKEEKRAKENKTKENLKDQPLVHTHHSTQKAGNKPGNRKEKK